MQTFVTMPAASAFEMRRRTAMPKALKHAVPATSVRTRPGSVSLRTSTP